MRQRVEEALKACRRDWRILQQSGVVLGVLPSLEEALRASEISLNDFLEATRSIVVPLNVDIQLLLDDYFNLRPPFSEKKRREFPDAIVVSSLQRWCRESGHSVYIVSGDRDFDEVCKRFEKFHKVGAIAEILTHASVSKEVHRTLADQLRANSDVDKGLVEEIKGRRAETSGASRSYMPGPISAEGYVTHVEINEIDGVNVIDAKRGVYTCSITFSANLALRLEVTDLNWDGFDVVNYSMTQSFSGEVVVSHEEGWLKIESVAVDEEMINLDEEVDELH
jgi:hypothetical protein